MTILAIASGLLIGLSLGALGGGGSILTVPAMVYLLAMDAHQATGASLIVVGIAAVVGAITHARAGRVALKDGVIFGLLGTAGAYAGSRASAAVPSNVLLAGFGVLMLVAAGAMIARQRSRSGTAGPDLGPTVAGEAGSLANGRGGPAARPMPDGPSAGVAGPSQPATSAGAVATLTTDAPPDVAEPAAAPRRGRLGRAVLVAAAATGVGLITGFFGVGGGFVIVPVLVLVLGFGMATAVGTSLLVIAIDSVASLATRLGHGGLILNWAVIGIFTGAAVIGAIVGGRVAGRVDQRRLSIAFIALIIVLAAYTLARSLPGLA